MWFQKDYIFFQLQLHFKSELSLAYFDQRSVVEVPCLPSPDSAVTFWDYWALYKNTAC